MYYEFYIDQFFLEHLLTGSLLIAASIRIQRKKLSPVRVLAGSTVNAVIVTMLVCLGMPEWYFTGMLLAGVILFAGRKREEWFSGLFFLLLVTVCFSGILEMLIGLFGFPLIAGTVVSVLLLDVTGRFLLKQKVLQDSLVMVRLQWEERSEILCGMIDTGNQLEEPLTRRPVSIIEASLAKRLLGDAWEERRGFYLIPYHSIGAERGWMRGVTIDEMTVKVSGNTAVIKRPILAIYEGELSAGKRYQMILHPLHVQPENKC